MFTPLQTKKVWSGWLSPPQPKAHAAAAVSSAAEKNSTPPTNNNNSNGDLVVLRSGGQDVLSINRDALASKVADLEYELYEYQYNMGLLLIEKKEWTSKYEVLLQALEEAHDTLKRESIAHTVALSEIETREDNLRKALGVEKQCTRDLEKVLHEMHSEHAEIKFTADSKLDEAKALVTSIEEKSLEVEAKLHAADAKLAEVNRKSSVIDRNALELEGRENALRRERSSFNTDQEAHENALNKQREDLREWQRKMQEGESRLAEGQKLLNQREERANETDLVLKQKEDDIEQLQKKIDVDNSNLKANEDDINCRLANLNLKEKEYDNTEKRLNLKENDLRALEEKLNERERVEIAKIVDEHNNVLAAKKREFELELDERKKAVDDELKNKVVEVDRKEAAVSHLEKKLEKKEQALDKKLEKLKEKEKELETRAKDLKEREKSIKAEEKTLETEKTQMLVDKEELIILKCDAEKVRDEIEEQKKKVNDERKKLEITEEERSQILRLQSELKQEIEDCRLQKQLILKEAEDLKEQRKVFERDWEELDVKSAGIERGLKDLMEQKDKFDKIKNIEKESMEKEKQDTHKYLQRELEALKLAEQSFAATMEHEKREFSEKLEIEKTELIRDFELQKTELETKMQHRQEEMENRLHEKEKLFEEERDLELNHINRLKEVSREEAEKIKLERSGLERDKQELAANQRHMEKHQFEMRNDIDELVNLSKKLKGQREQFSRERERFIAFVEKLNGCTSCGEVTREFVLSDLQSLPEIENMEALLLPRLPNNYLQHNSNSNVVGTGRRVSGLSLGVGSSGSPSVGMTRSILRFCTSKIFNVSPVKHVESAAFQNPREGQNSGELQTIEVSKRLSSTEDEPELSYGIASDSCDVQRIHSGKDISLHDEANLNLGVLEDSQRSDTKGTKCKPGKRGRSRVNRTHSVKEVIENAKAIVGEALEDNESADLNGHVDDFVHTTVNSQGEYTLADKGEQTSRRKRNRLHSSQTASEQDAENDSEGHSYSAAASGGRKRRQKVAPAVQTPGEGRYNLRRPRVATPAAGARTSSKGGGSKGSHKPKKFGAALVSSQEVASENGESAHFAQFETSIGNQDCETNMIKKVVSTTALSDEVNGTPVMVEDEEGYKTESLVEDGDESEDDEDNEEESMLPGEVSIGKKVWTFLTT